MGRNEVTTRGATNREVRFAKKVIFPFARVHRGFAREEKTKRDKQRGDERRR